jgi:hypothetical protein
MKKTRGRKSRDTVLLTGTFSDLLTTFTSANYVWSSDGGGDNSPPLAAERWTILVSILYLQLFYGGILAICPFSPSVKERLPAEKKNSITFLTKLLIG